VVASTPPVSCGYFLALHQQSEFEKKLFRRQKIWHRKLEVSAIKPKIFAAKCAI